MTAILGNALQLRGALESFMLIRARIARDDESRRLAPMEDSLTFADRDAFRTWLRDSGRSAVRLRPGCFDVVALNTVE